MRGLGLRRVLDQLKQIIAEHNFARRAGQIYTDLIAFGCRFVLLTECLHRILDKMRATLNQVLALLTKGGCDDLGIGQRKVRR